MSKKLVIVESPAKSKTIAQYLGGDYTVESSVGHIRDLAIVGMGGLGVDVENDFKPTYEVLPEKKKVIHQLNKSLKDADELYLATDPDREGEAISWHLSETLNIKNQKVYRVIFNEITREAILESFEHPGQINRDLVNSQETRRILDRIIGFKLSKLLQSKIKSKSAGRVQSAALKIIVDREDEISAFQVEEYYEIYASIEEMDAKLVKFKGENPQISSQKKAEELIESLSEQFNVGSITTKPYTTNPKPAFITSTLQQLASSKYGFNPTRTMKIAQSLYEGIDIGNETVGLITYMRTDSTRMSTTFISQAEQYIKEEYGAEYYGNFRKTKKQDNVQDAHEAIRPTSIHRTPKAMKQYLNPAEYKLYQLIFARAVASLMKPKKTEVTSMI
ncbi:MAG: type I DNA topoisomerase, partial [Bacilli bacterium]|nr:type I DNA topoisomerase [Bacilli bacterium]